MLGIGRFDGLKLTYVDWGSQHWFVYILDSSAASLMFFIMFARVLKPSGLCSNHTGVGMAQLVSVRLSEQEVPG